MFYAHALCRRVNPSAFGDDEPENTPTFTSANAQPTLKNTQTVSVDDAWQQANPTAAAVGKFAETYLGASHASPALVANPLLPIEGMIPGTQAFSAVTADPVKAATPWLKGVVVIGAIGVGVYALGQAATIAKAVRG